MDSLGFVLFRLENAQFASANGAINAPDDINDAVQRPILNDSQPPWKTENDKPVLIPGSQRCDEIKSEMK